MFFKLQLPGLHGAKRRPYQTDPTARPTRVRRHQGLQEQARCHRVRRPLREQGGQLRRLRFRPLSRRQKRVRGGTPAAGQCPQGAAGGVASCLGGRVGKKYNIHCI